MPSKLIPTIAPSSPHSRPEILASSNPAASVPSKPALSEPAVERQRRDQHRQRLRQMDRNVSTRLLREWQDSGAETTAESQAHVTALRALRSGNAQALNSVIASASPAELERSDGLGWNLLTNAIMLGNKQAVHALLKAGVNVCACNSDGSSALHWAMHRGEVELLEHDLLPAAHDMPVQQREAMLVKARDIRTVIAEALRYCDNPQTRLQQAKRLLDELETSKFPEHTLAKLSLLPQDRLPIGTLGAAFIKSFYWGSSRFDDVSPAIKAFLLLGGDPDLRSDIERPSQVAKDVPLLFSAVLKKCKSAQYLLDAGADLQQCTADGNNALAFLLKENHFDQSNPNFSLLVERMSQAGLSLEKPDAEGITPFMRTCAWNEFERAENLFDHGASPALPATEMPDSLKQRSAIHWMASKYHYYGDKNQQVPALLEKIIRQHKDRPDARNADSIFNHRDSEGNTPFMLALQNKRSGIVRVLLESGLLTAAQSCADGTLLHQWARDGGGDVLETLLNDPSFAALRLRERIDEADSQGKTALHHCITFHTGLEQGRHTTISGSNWMDIPRENTLLMEVNADAFKALLGAGADINGLYQGRTMLDHACLTASNPLTVEMLVENGAQFAPHRLAGELPAHLLARNPHVGWLDKSIFKYIDEVTLLSKNEAGQTPYDVARTLDNESFGNRIQEHFSNTNNQKIAELIKERIVKPWPVHDRSAKDLGARYQKSETVGTPVDPSRSRVGKQGLQNFSGKFSPAGRDGDSAQQLAAAAARLAESLAPHPAVAPAVTHEVLSYLGNDRAQQQACRLLGAEFATELNQVLADAVVHNTSPSDDFMANGVAYMAAP